MSTSPTGQDPLSSPRHGMNRRRLVAGSVAAGVTGVGLFRLVRAQDDTATPDAASDQATSSGTPEASTGEATQQDDATFASAALDRVDEAIASVAADRDAVASDIEVTDIDGLIDQAGVHRDLAQAALDVGDNVEARRQAFVAVASAHAARELIETRLGYAGLPTQEAAASRTLTRIQERIAAVAEESASATDVNVEFFVSQAQALYTAAHDLYGTGAYAQAIGTGRVAGTLAGIATALMVDASQIGLGRGGMFGGGRRGPGRGGFDRPGRGMMPDDYPGIGTDGPGDDGVDTDATPESVPAANL